jgi:NTE family protein
MRNPFRPRVGLVLGGGGARGLSHLGILKVLEAERVPVDLIVGTSAGAIVGALFAVYGNARDAESRLVEFAGSPQFKSDKFRDLQHMTPLETDDHGLIMTLRRFYKLGLFFATTLFKESFIDPDQFERDLASIIPDCLIQEAQIPLAIVTTDLGAGREVALTEGSLRTAIWASSAIAGIFPPVVVDGKELVDGGFVNKVPVEVALRMGADVVIAADVSQDVLDSQEFSRRGTAISVRANAILAETLKNLQMRFADVVIRPEVNNIHWADFASIADITPIGETAARAALPAVREAILRGYAQRAKKLSGIRRKWHVDLGAPEEE